GGEKPFPRHLAGTPWTKPRNRPLGLFGRVHICFIPYTASWHPKALWWVGPQSLALGSRSLAGGPRTLAPKPRETPRMKRPNRRARVGCTYISFLPYTTFWPPKNSCGPPSLARKPLTFGTQACDILASGTWAPDM